MINPVDRLSWQEMLGHPASEGHLVDTQVNTAYNKMAVLSDHIDEFKDLYDFVFRIKGWLRYYLQAYYGLKVIPESGLDNDTNGMGGDIDLIDPITGDIKTKKVWRIYIKNYDEMIKASENGLPIPTPIVRFANIYDPSNPSYLDLSYDDNGNPTFSGTFNTKDPNSFIPLWYLKNISVDRSISTTTDSHGIANKRLVVSDVINFSDGFHINVSGAADVPFVATGGTVNITGDATGTGTVDANGNVVVPTTVSHAARADNATNADHAASADKTIGGTVNITGYVSGSGSFDRNGNVTVDVVPNIADTPSTWYVGKTNARDYWGKDENGNMWGSTKDHPFASLTYAINQSNSHVFPGNTINIYVNDSGEYADGGGIFVTSRTIVRGTTSEHPVFRCWWDMTLSATLGLSAVDFAIRKATTADDYPDGLPFFRVGGSGTLYFENGCHMVIDTDNFGRNTWPFIEMNGFTSLELTCNHGTALYLELRGNGVTHKASYITFAGNSSFGIVRATGSMAAIKLVSPSGTKHTGSVLSLYRFASTWLLGTPSPSYKMYFDWDIADDSGTAQVDLGKFASLTLYKNPDKGQALPGSSVGNVPDLADYIQRDYA